MFLWNVPVNNLRNIIVPLRVIHLTALANQMISCRVFISTHSAEGRHILFFNGCLDYIRPQCLILFGSYKPFSLFLQIPIPQPIPWPLSLDLLCWAPYLAMKRLGLPLLNLLSFLLFIVRLWGSSFSFLSLQVLLFFAVVPWCFERNRPTPSLLWEHTPPGHSIYNPRKVVESRIGQHPLVDEKYHEELSVYGYLFFFSFFFLFLSMASSSALL